MHGRKKDVPYHVDYVDDWVGEQIGITDWFEIDQARIDAFADATKDHNPLHVDPTVAKEGPFGVTVAHGFLTLSLLSFFSYEAALQPGGTTFGINYGFDRVRFMAPVKVGDRVRNRTILSSYSRLSPKSWVFKTRNTVEIENQPKRALVANWLGMYVKE